MGLVFATMLISLVYFVGKHLIGTWIGAFTSAFLFTFDFMNFSMGRMATVDVYLAFFSLASQLFFLIYIKGFFQNGWKTSVTPLFLAVFFFSLGFSTKWIVIFGFLGQIFILLVLRLRNVFSLKNGISAKIKGFFSHPFFPVVFFAVLAFSIYFLRLWSNYNGSCSGISTKGC